MAEVSREFLGYLNSNVIAEWLRIIRRWQCYSGPIAYPFLPQGFPVADIMVLKAQTDAWTVGNDGVKQPYVAAEITWLMELAAEVRETFVLDKVANVFSANCIYHTAEVMFWDQIKVNGTSLGDAVQQWYFENTTTTLVDSCVTPLCNPSCV